MVEPLQAVKEGPRPLGALRSGDRNGPARRLLDQHDVVELVIGQQEVHLALLPPQPVDVVFGEALDVAPRPRAVDESEGAVWEGLAQVAMQPLGPCTEGLMALLLRTPAPC